ncbi:hypothetical protein GPJ56_008196 [Histomonas meleagridis]|uniref:uncharacterized protein n=1 Tax=Histomonas meleagridis TaxID=135588 RepID=UPI00355A5789|nr:hypothetical protein GPJ56_008196 [Histomonas meleagridis]KAH0797217.1 hypothetical protein GO595_009899 [Histomonas meleagridis]
MGGGLYANTQGIVNLSNTIFEGCVCIGNTSYGGAVYSESSQLILFNTTFTGCGCQTPYPTQSTGGGLYAKQNIVSDASILNFTFTVFSDCSAYDGSFFYAENYNRMILNYTNITTSSSTSIPLSFISLNYNDLLITNPLLYIYALLLSAKNTNTKYISAQSSTSTLAQTFYENSFQSGTIGTIYLQEATTINGDIDFLPPLKTSDGSINFDFASNYPPLPISGGGSGEEATTSYEVTTSEIITLNESTFEESLNESTSNEDNGGGLSTAAIVCIVLACALFIGIIIAVVIVTLRNGSCARERSNDPFDVGIERRTNKQSTYF